MNTRRYFAIPGLLVLVGLMVMPISGGEFEARYPGFFQALENAAHPLIFALVALGCLAFTRQGSHADQHGAAYLKAFGMAAALGAATELLQLFVDRDASWLDFVNDLLGAAFALLVRARMQTTNAAIRLRHGALFVPCALLLGALAIAPLVWSGAAYIHRESQLPVLWQSTSTLDKYFSADNGATYPGLHLGEPWPDWTGKNQLWITISYTGSSSTRVWVRVHDVRHNYQFDDRYNGMFSLQPNTQTLLKIPFDRIVSAPKGRVMDMRSIAGVSIFREAASAPGEMQVLEVSLSDQATAPGMLQVP
jgi:hypothetical protein